MRHRSLAACALAAALLGACGGDESFIDDYNEATRPLQEVNDDVARLGRDAGSLPPAEAARRFDRLAAKSGEVNASLDELEAPDDARAAFDRLRAQLRRGEEDLGAFAAAVRANSPGRLQKAAADLTSTGERIADAERAVKAKVED